MQWIAMLTMLTDHIGLVWFPESPIWRIIGRISFPIYTYLIVVGLTRTRSVPRYLKRLGILAIVSQIPFSLLIQTWTINVIGTFFVSAGALYLMDRMKEHPLRYLWPIAAGILMETVAFDYGAYGLLLLLIFRYTRGHSMFFSHVGLNVLYVALYQAPLQLFSFIPTLIIAYWPSFASHTSYRAPNWIWRYFYPGHLLILYLITFILYRP